METYALFQDRVLELVNHALTPAYFHVYRGLWNNQMFPRMKRDCHVTSWENGWYEVVLPTQESMDRNLQGHRIIVKVVPKLDPAVMKDLVKDLVTSRTRFPGKIDSETIFLVAPELSDAYIKESYTKGPKWKGRRRAFLRAFNHSPKVWLNLRSPGYKTCPIITRVPEIAVKRILMILANFIKRRLQALLKALKLEPWMTDYIKEERLYYMDILEHFSLSVRNMVKSFSHGLRWMLDKLREVMHEIGRQNMVLHVKEEVSRLREIMVPFTLTASPMRREPEGPLIAKLIEVLATGPPPW